MLWLKSRERFLLRLKKMALSIFISLTKMTQELVQNYSSAPAEECMFIGNIRRNQREMNSLWVC